MKGFGKIPIHRILNGASIINFQFGCSLTKTLRLGKTGKNNSKLDLYFRPDAI